MVIAVREEIPKEEFNKMKTVSYGDLCIYAEEVQARSGFPPNAYGNYGARLIFDNTDGKYYLEYKRGSSCD